MLLALIPNLAGARGGYVLGAKPFAEQYILAALMEDRLRAKGLTASRRDGLGSAVIFDALAAGDIDAYVEYSGTLWANQMRRTDVLPARAGAVGGRQVGEGAPRHRHARRARLRERLRAGADTQTRGTSSASARLPTWRAHAPTLSIAGDYEFFGRPEWKAIRETYGLAFRQQRQMQAEFMYPAVAAGEVDVISAYTSDGRIAQFDLKVLDDPTQCDPALRRDPAGVAEACERQGLPRRAASPRRCDQRGGDARGQPARRRGRIAGRCRQLDRREVAALSIVARIDRSIGSIGA